MSEILKAGRFLVGKPNVDRLVVTGPSTTNQTNVEQPQLDFERLVLSVDLRSRNGLTTEYVVQLVNAYQGFGEDGLAVQQTILELLSLQEEVA